MKRSHNFTVLVVDDSVDERYLIREYITRGMEEGVCVVEASDSKTMRRHLEQSAPDCVVMDYLMGVEDGIDILRSIKESKLTLPPVIFCTGFADPEVEKEAEQLGVHLFLNKGDITQEHLCAELQKIQSAK